MPITPVGLSTPEFNLADPRKQLERGLKSRHIQFLALGGAMGTGLFVGSGSILSETGPSPLFMGYLSMIFIVWVVMNHLAEMFVLLPMKGISIPYFVGRFVEPSLAFAARWNYSVQTCAAAIVLDYWKAPVSVAVWITMVLLIILLLNVIAVSFFGEAEFYASPFVIGFQRAGIHGLNRGINAAILTSVWSAGNSFLYSGSRVLYSMSLRGQAPKLFSHTKKCEVPYVAVIFTWLFGLLAYLNVSNTGATVFNRFVNMSTMSGFIAWIVVMINYLRFRAAFEHHGLLHTLPYRTPLQPYATYAVLRLLTFICLLTLTNGFQVFWPDKFSASNFLAAYITLPIFLEMDELAEREIPRKPKNWLQRAWFWLA
ncbi:hypothetical protein NA56DRAFT_737292 [Hyaloscypha hepaticicola]|uniref:Amino acid permease/ SLC12A domain-containing protein n=1 Tax=Hyaloscypha hepaticicola TaxID=2082293 RepID=A0A2J6PHR3_9HELO|nr:hypothetical protein NA56DRAFT_737292 [Hyaloscypha hepaticicola]